MASTYSFQVSNILLHVLRVFTALIFGATMLLSRDDPITQIFSPNKQQSTTTANENPTIPKNNKSTKSA